MSYLMVLEGCDAGKIYELATKNTLGTGEENSIVLTDRRLPIPTITIEKQDKGYCLIKHSAAIQVRVNDQPVQQRLLAHGDIVKIATTTLLFHAGNDHYEPKNAETEVAEPQEVIHILHCVNPQSSRHSFLQKNLESKTGGRLRMLLNVSIAISEIQELDILLKRILTVICRELPADRGFIALVKPQKRYEFKAFYSRNKREKCELTYNKKVTKKTLLCGKATLTKADRKATNSCLSVPLHSKETLLGIIQLEAVGGYNFTDNDLDQLRNVSMQIAMAIENLYEYQQPLRHRKHLISLERLSQSLSSHLNKETILRQGLKAAQNLFHSTRVSILQLDDSEEYLRISHAVGIPQNEWAAIKIPIQSTISGKVFHKNKPLLVRNTQKIPRSLCRDSHGQYHSTSCILAPIRITNYQSSQKKAIGVICVTDKENGEEFTHLDRNLLALLANQIGIALTNAELYEKATIEPLTRLYTKGYFLQRLQEEVYHAQEAFKPLSLIMFDLDHFKSVNDTYTHQAGDRVLTQMGAFIKEQLVSNEISGRYGGEEFMVLSHLGYQEAIERANRIRAGVASYTFVVNDRQHLSMTSSIGVSSLRNTDTTNLLIERADQALYIAKARGRNCVIGERELDRHFSKSTTERRIQPI